MKATELASGQVRVQTQVSELMLQSLPYSFQTEEIVQGQYIVQGCMNKKFFTL